MNFTKKIKYTDFFKILHIHYSNCEIFKEKKGDHRRFFR